MKVNGTSLWMVVNEETGEVVYCCAHPTKSSALNRAGVMIADSLTEGGRYTPAQLRRKGYKAVRVTELKWDRP